MLEESAINCGEEAFMKKTVLAAFLLVIICSVPWTAVARGDWDRNGEEGEINSSLGLQGWFSSAEAKWQISFPYTTQLANPGIAAGTSGRGESELDFRKMSSPVFIMTGGGKINSFLSFDVLYGTGSISGGRGTDTDRFDPSTGGGLEFSQSQNDVSGDVKMWGINLYASYNPSAYPKSDRWGIVFGYLHYEDDLKLQNAVQTVSVQFDGTTFPPPGPFPPNMALNSTYDFSWNAIKVGVTRQAALAQRLSCTAMLSVYPYVTYRGEGYWNLRAGTSPADFRLQSPNFIQTSTSGYGYEAMLGLAYDVSETVELSAGYRYFYLYARAGTDTVYFADGSTSDSNLDWVTVTRQGAYAGVRFRF